MNPLEQRLHYPMGEALPEVGQTLEVAPGIRWVRMSLPFALDHINLWLLRDEITLDGTTTQGWTLVDCGISHPDTQQAWEQVFATSLDGLPILRVVVTHMHPDHVGLAHWMCQRWSVAGRRCMLHMSSLDFAMAHLGSMGGTAFGGDEAADFFAEHGLTDPEDIAKVRARRNHFSGLVPKVPGQHHPLRNGTVLRIGQDDWHCISGYGHAPEHIALHCPARGLFISGDMLLPRISTNISVYVSDPESDPLGLFMASLDQMHHLPSTTLVLPSHGRPFGGPQTTHGCVQERIAQLKIHHHQRLDELQAAASQRPLHAYEALGLLFKRKLDLHQTTFAMGESIAHLNHLWHTGRLTRARNDQGVFVFAAS